MRASGMLQGGRLYEITDNHRYYIKKLIKWIVKEKLQTSNNITKHEDRKIVDELAIIMKDQYMNESDRKAINLVINEHNEWVRKKKEQKRIEDSFDDITWAM